MMTSKYNILTAIGSLLKKPKYQPLAGCDSILKKSSGLQELNKQIFFPLTSQHRYRYRKESLLNKTTVAYLNSVHPTKLRLNLNEAPSKKHPGLKEAPSHPSDVIYEYLKSFSKYSNRKNGLLLTYNQHIVSNFNKRNLLLRGVEPLIDKTLKSKTNKNQSQSTKAVQFTVAFQLARTKVAKATQNINKNIDIDNLLNKPLLLIYPGSNTNTPKAPFANTHRTEEPNAPKRVHTEIPQDLILRLNRLKGVSGETGYNRKGNNKLIKYSYKLLYYFFKSIYCLISKPVFLFTPDKVVIQLFYFLNIPKFEVFKWYSIIKSKLNRQKREKQIKKNKNKQGKSMDKLRFNLHSAAGLAQEQNHNEKLSSIHTFNSVNPLVHLRNELLPVACGLVPVARSAKARADAKSNCVRLQEGQKGKKKKMKNTKLKVHWKVARTLIRLMKKGTKLQNILFNLNKYNLFKVFSPKFKLICEILNKKFKKPVELQLIRIHQPFQDSNILVNLLSLNIRNKKFKTNVQIDKLFQKRVIKSVYDYQNKSVNFIPTYLSGINIRIGGRLMREPIIPRISKKNFERGARSIGKANYLDSASITNKNRKGSYTLKIFSGQNFF